MSPSAKKAMKRLAIIVGMPVLFWGLVLREIYRAWDDRQYDRLVFWSLLWIVPFLAVIGGLLHWKS